VQLSQFSVNEVLSMRLSDVSFQDARTRVWEKGGKERVLPLPPLLLQLLHDYVELERDLQAERRPVRR
jgi:integrase